MSHFEGTEGMNTLKVISVTMAAVLHSKARPSVLVLPKPNGSSFRLHFSSCRIPEPSRRVQAIRFVAHVRARVLSDVTVTSVGDTVSHAL
jgi:DUF971 family protein